MSQVTYRDPVTGKFITREHWLELQEDERGDVDSWDDFEDFDQFDEEDYAGE